MALAVVGGLSAVRFDFNLVLLRTILDLQRTFSLRDVVVVGLRVVLQRVAECVRTAADRQLAAAEFVRRAFAFDPPGLDRQAVRVLAFDVFIRQRYSIELLLRVAARQCHVALVDLQFAVIGGVIVVRVSGFDLVGHGADVGDTWHFVGPGRAAVRAVLNRRALGHAGRGAAIMGRTVVHVAVVNSLDRHGRLLDRQLAGGEDGRFRTFFGINIECGDIVVVGICDREGYLIKASVIICSNISTGCRGVPRYCQDIIFRQSFNFVLIGINRASGPCNGFRQSVAILR